MPAGIKLLVISQFLFPILRILRLERVFELLVKQQPFEDLADGTLVGGAARRDSIFWTRSFSRLSASNDGAIWFHE